MWFPAFMQILVQHTKTFLLIAMLEVIVVALPSDALHILIPVENDLCGAHNSCFAAESTGKICFKSCR